MKMATMIILGVCCLLLDFLILVMCGLNAFTISLQIICVICTYIQGICFGIKLVRKETVNDSSAK